MGKSCFSSHKLPKLQSTSFGSQGILGVNVVCGTLDIVHLPNYHTTLYEILMENDVHHHMQYDLNYNLKLSKCIDSMPQPHAQFIL
jgi:hypothetical protein